MDERFKSLSYGDEERAMQIKYLSGFLSIVPINQKTSPKSIELSLRITERITSLISKIKEGQYKYPFGFTIKAAL